MSNNSGNAKYRKNEPRSAVGAALEDFLSLGGVSPESAQCEQLVDFSIMIAEWGKKMNLSGYRDPCAVMRHLVCDALALWAGTKEFLSGDIQGPIIDLGSGAGLPGIPMAIVEPRTEVVLVESREKRNHFQRAVRRQLALVNVHLRLGRIEALEPVRGNLVFAQAVARSDRVLSLGIPWLRDGGTIVIPGKDPSMNPGPHPAIVASGILSYALPGMTEPRFMWWGRVGR